MLKENDLSIIYLNLGDSTGRGRDSCEVELSEQMVVLGHGTLTHVHLNEYKFLNIQNKSRDLV